MAIFFGIPSTPPPPPVRRSARIRHSWTGWDGSQWNLTDHSGSSGVVLADSMLDGLGMPAFERYVDKSATRHGQILRGFNVGARDVLWPLFLYVDEGSDAWVEYDSAFWRSLHPLRTGWWTVQAPGSAPRTLACTFADAPGYPRDPAEAQWALYAVSLIADDPFWKGVAPSPEFRADQPVNWLGGGPVDEPGAGTPLVIGANSNTRSAWISNPGDLDLWVRWELKGPLDAGTRLGVGDRVVTIDVPIADGSTAVIDTDPSVQTIFIDGVEYVPGIRARFAPIPDGKRVPVVVEISGGGSAIAHIEPRYFRAW